MRRYSFLSKEAAYEALNRLRSAFLAAKDGDDVEEIIRGVLTSDERFKIGRRIQIAQLLRSGVSYEDIRSELKVGFTTINFVDRNLRDHPQAYDLVEEREEKVERTYKEKAYRKSGGSKLVFKKREYTGFTRKDVSR